MHIGICWLKWIESSCMDRPVKRLALRVATRAGLRSRNRVPVLLTVAVQESLRSLLLLLHHQVNHVVLVHQLLTVTDSIFTLRSSSVLRLVVFGLGVGVSCEVGTNRPLEVLHVGVVGLDSWLGGQNIGCGLVGELWLVLFRQGQFRALIPIENLIFFGGLRRVREHEGSALEVVALVRGLSGYGRVGVVLLNILVDEYARRFEHVLHHELGYFSRRRCHCG